MIEIGKKIGWGRGEAPQTPRGEGSGQGYSPPPSVGVRSACPLCIFEILA